MNLTTVTRPQLFNGLHLEVDTNHLDMMWSYELSDGSVWQKRVYPRASYPDRLYRWATIEEIGSYLISFENHSKWISHQVPERPPPGAILFYNRAETKSYRNDGYDWKKRKSLSTIVREDRVKLKLAGFQIVHGCYVHSSSNENLHRRTYSLISNPDLVMVHYLEIGSRQETDQNRSRAEASLSNLPSDWNMLTISDCNLCALLDLVDNEISAESLLSQLSVILKANLQQASNFEDALSLNNDGLPFDMLLNSRSKNLKMKIENGNYGQPSKTPSSNPPGSSLFQTPNLLLYQSGNGTMGCFVTLPAPLNTTGLAPILPKEPHALLGAAKSPEKAGKMNGVENKSTSLKKAAESNVTLADLLSRMNSSSRQPSSTGVPPARSSISIKHNTRKDCDLSELSTLTSNMAQLDTVLPPLSPLSSSQELGTNTAENPAPSSTSCTPNLTFDGKSSIQSKTLSSELTISSYDPYHHQTMLATQIPSLNTDILNFQQISQFSENTYPNLKHDAPLSPLTELMNSLIDDYPSSGDPPTITPTTSANLQSPSFMSAVSSTPRSSSPDNCFLDNNIPSGSNSTLPSIANKTINHLVQNVTARPSVDLCAPLFQLSSNSYSSLDTPCDSFASTENPAHEYEDLESLMKTIIPDPIDSTNQQPPVIVTAPLDNFDFEFNSKNLNVFDSQAAFSFQNSGSASETSPLVELDLANSLSLPDLSSYSDTSQGTRADEMLSWSQFVASQQGQSSTSARSSSCLSNMSGFLQDIPEGSQMELEEIPSEIHQFIPDYRTSCSSIPSSPGQASLSSQSSTSAHDIFDSDSPSVLELCEMLSESKNVEQNDFSHLTLTDSEQLQLFRAAKTIQNAFRQYKNRRQARNKQKKAALMIEKYYREYKKVKQRQDRAARKIQQQYRFHRMTKESKQ